LPFQWTRVAAPRARDLFARESERAVGERPSTP
jgi:hypothetical protein